MKKLKVSIAMTMYNCEKFIEDALRSIKIQTYKTWEIVLIDDSSTDSTLSLCEHLCKKLKIQDKVKIIKHDKNFGYGKSLKDAIEEGTGELVVIVDSDDALSHKNVLKIVVDIHQKHPEISMTYSNYKMCDENLIPYKDVKTRQIRQDELYISKDYYLGNTIKISHLKVFKRSCYNKTSGLNEKLIKNVDKDLTIKLEEVGPFIYIDEYLYLYRRHSNSLGSSFKRQSKEFKNRILQDKLDMMSEARKRRYGK